MNHEALEQALQPVRAYFRGTHISTNTVLAAHMRARSLVPTGLPWDVAKAVLSAGGSFEAAVDEAKSYAPSPTPAPASEHLAVPMPVFSAASPRRGAPLPPPEPFSGRLDWYAKPFGPGDIDGKGSRKLLGTPHLDQSQVLVRETAQNSWDARGSSSSIRFVLNLRRLKLDELQVLRERVFTGGGQQLNLVKLLHMDELWCLEVTDRGTVGLNGPVRNDLRIDHGADRNFIDLVFNIGSPRDEHLGAGTYGFGKTIAYVISSVGSVVIWSRCRHKGQLEHRLIGSAMGDAFNLNGRRYTGRHWWGRMVDDGARIEPLLGEDARELAERVFASRFDGDATGTSFLILDPILSGDTREDQAKHLRKAVRWNLWPKFLAEPSGLPAMDIQVLFDGAEIDLPDPGKDPELDGYARCLQAVREVQQHGSDPQKFLPLIEVTEIRSLRPKALLGHLALARAPMPPSRQDGHHSVAFMRHRAELVVKYKEFRSHEVPGFEWMGVFKPTAEVDDSYAAAEPPAHDDWVPASIQDSTMKRHVNIGLRQIKAVVDVFLQPAPVDPGDSGGHASVVHVGDMLGDLVATTAGSAPSPARAAGGGSGARGSARLRVTGFGTDPSGPDGWAVTTLEVAADPGRSGGILADMDVKVGVDGGSMGDAQAIRVVGWSVGRSGPWEAGPVSIDRPGTMHFRYEHQVDLAVDVRPRIEAR